jgi:2-(1,2-epoxy-1,2-dihydrophenyl)acetyl-CoA isomerase
MTYAAITVEHIDGVDIITLNRPDSLNAIDNTLKAELMDAVCQANIPSSKTRCMLITGAGRGFCSGADLVSSIANGPVDAGTTLLTTYNPLIIEMARSKVPIVCAINGIAAGAGMSIALAGDIVIAGSSAIFLQAFINIGLVPDAGSSYILPRLIGSARANAMMLLGEKIDAKTAEDWGLVYKTVPDDALMGEAMKIALKLANGPSQAYGAIRRMSRESQSNSLSEQLSLEAESQRMCSYSEDFLEGVMAFTQKRVANFKGK